MPLSLVSAACLKALLTLSAVVDVFSSNTQSVSEALTSGTLTASPLIRPSNSGNILVIAVAEPVLVGIRERLLARARLKSEWYSSSTLCVLVKS